MASSQPTPQLQSTLNFRYVCSAADVEVLRVIRNDCREFMTHDQRYITRAMQEKWWADRFNRHTLPLIAYQENRSIGYGMVKWDVDGIPWISGGLRKAYRGKGYGRPLFEELVRIAVPGPVYLDVYRDNAPARKLYSKLGFRQHSHSEDLIVMRLNS